MRPRLALFAAGLCCAATSATAQTPAAEPYQQALSINPLGIPFEAFSGEYERAVSPGITFGVGASYFGAFDEADYLSGDAKVRYYPNERAIRGFSIGGSLGFARVSEDDDEFADGSSTTGFTLGVILDYNWLLGRSKRFFVGTGLGAKRIFIDEDEVGEDVAVGYPTARLQVGFAF